VERFGPAVFKRCRAVAGDPESAEDLAQEVFSRLCDVVSRPERDRDDIPWKLVEGIMRNVFCEYIRRKKRNFEVLRPDVSATDSDQPNGGAEFEEKRERIRALVDKLLLPEQEVILARHFLGMDMAEIARFFGKPRSTLVDAYNRGMLRLREMAKDNGLLP
jgi:RNA polymerase sigma factor (sigma-70 family)